MSSAPVRSWKRSRTVRDSAELIQNERAGAVLDAMCDTFRPDAVIYDLPPLLSSDDVIAFLPWVDCVLLVAAAGVTRAVEIKECEHLLSEQTSILGVLLNKAGSGTRGSYQEAYR